MRNIFLNGSSIPYLIIIRERKGLGSPKLAGWNTITRITSEPI